MIGMPAGEAKAAKGASDADQGGRWPGAVDEQLQEGSEAQKDQNTHGGVARSSPMRCE